MDFKKVLITLLFPLAIFCKDSFVDPWGKDTVLLKQQKSSSQNVHKKNMGIKLAHGIIHFYQRNISPANGPKSNFRPTSSKYMELAIKNHGFFKGFLMGCDRLMRENTDPWLYRTIDIDGLKVKYDPPHQNSK